MAGILIIDDEPGIRRLIARVLKHAGHEVHEAGNGAEGVAAFQQHHPALVITDLIMPEREGIEIIREFRERAPELRILAISGSTPRREFYLHAAIALGADASLAKPFRPVQLLRTIEKLLNREAAESGKAR